MCSICIYNNPLILVYVGDHLRLVPEIVKQIGSVCELHLLGLSIGVLSFGC